jgi:hypothetical protein
MLGGEAACACRRPLPSVALRAPREGKVVHGVGADTPAPLALIAYSQVILWHRTWGHKTSASASGVPLLPWYTDKAGVTFPTCWPRSAVRLGENDFRSSGIGT